jgi:toxin-antitoxin system PIN domain toxin
MKLVDANVLLYADNESAEHHETSRAWLTAALGGLEPLIIPWLNVVTYLRISTHPRLHASPNSVSDSLEFIGAVLGSEVVVAGEPDRHHLDRIADLLAQTGRGGNLVNDAHLAALALQYDATIISYDNDFSRFPGVSWGRPDASAN